MLVKIFILLEQCEQLYTKHCEKIITLSTHVFFILDFTDFNIYI